MLSETETLFKGGKNMLPEYRQKEYLYDVPSFAIENENVAKSADELYKFYEKYAACFARSEPRGRFFDYMAGQLSNLERKSIEPIAIGVNGINPFVQCKKR